MIRCLTRMLVMIGLSAGTLSGMALATMGQSKGADDGKAQIEAASAGIHIAASAAKRLERRLAAHPTDLILRSRLLGYYVIHTGSTARVQHILWLFRHAPAATITGSMYTDLDLDDNGGGVAAGRKIWAQQLRAYPHDVRILINAAAFYDSLHINNNGADKAQAERLYKLAQAMEPKNPDIAARLGHMYDLQIMDQTDAARQAIARRAQAQFEIWYRYTKAQEWTGGYSDLADLAKDAFEAGAYGKARTYANKMLDLAAHDSDPADLIHHGNMVLGRLALVKGEVEQAKSYLLAAARVKGSAPLDTFGPNMLLAQELLAKGERQVVLEYFRLCGRFWKSSDLKHWTGQVLRGETPDFGANLSY